MKYILIIAFITGGGNSGMSLATAEFNTQAACVAALEAAGRAMPGWSTHIRGVCVPKGE